MVATSANESKKEISRDSKAGLFRQPVPLTKTERRLERILGKNAAASLARLKLKPDYGPPYTKQFNEYLIEECRKHIPSVYQVHDFLHLGADPNAKSSEHKLGNTAVHLCAKKGNIQALQKLFLAGADANALNIYQQTPLMVCCERKSFFNRVVARFLLARGANTNLFDRGGNSALINATFAGDAKMVAMLLAHGAKPERDASHIALGADHPVDISEFIINKKKEKWVKDEARVIQDWKWQVREMWNGVVNPPPPWAQQEVILNLLLAAVELESKTSFKEIDALSTTDCLPTGAPAVFSLTWKERSLLSLRRILQLLSMCFRIFTRNSRIAAEDDELRGERLDEVFAQLREQRQKAPSSGVMSEEAKTQERRKRIKHKKKRVVTQRMQSKDAALESQNLKTAKQHVWDEINKSYIDRLYNPALKKGEYIKDNNTGKWAFVEKKGHYPYDSPKPLRELQVPNPGDGDLWKMTSP
mmetsp:Transcript_42341/g.72925  ORF Transcript_42341/g.72925 Transcript_42341/m.72925 type:complete len:473 (+) Transcript_42341:34-1452(+)